MTFFLTPFRLACLLLCLLCSACSQKTNPAPTASPPPSKGVLTEAQQKALDDAKKTEQVLQDANDAQMKKLDEAGG